MFTRLCAATQRCCGPQPSVTWTLTSPDCFIDCDAGVARFPAAWGQLLHLMMMLHARTPRFAVARRRHRLHYRQSRRRHCSLFGLLGTLGLGLTGAGGSFRLVWLAMMMTYAGCCCCCVAPLFAAVVLGRHHRNVLIPELWWRCVYSALIGELLRRGIHPKRVVSLREKGLHKSTIPAHLAGPVVANP